MPAKINLWLDVLGKRSDGYHELSSLMLPIGIYDELAVQVTDISGIQVACDHPDVPVDERNLAWKAARSFLERAQVEKGVSIEIRKGIPMAAGLGGGSSDAAGVLLALRECLQTPMEDAQLHALAKSLGADVPFFLYRRPALARGIGEVLEWVDGVPPYALVCIKPPFSVSTAWVYGTLKLTTKETPNRIDRLRERPWRMDSLLANDLEAVTLAAHPRLGEIKDWLVEHQALGALMSGSGPTVFGVFRDWEAANRVADLAREAWGDCWVAATKVLTALEKRDGGSRG